MARNVLLLFAAFWIPFGAACLLLPAQMLDPIALVPVAASSFAELRAMYGGSQIGLGLFFLYAARNESARRTGLLLAVLFVGGLACGRTIGIVVDGARDSMTLLFLGIEVATVVLSAFALSRDSRTAAIA